MDGRRHSVDLPLSRALVALRRVRSLRDPSTNSMSRFSATVDNMNWETNSSNAITLGFENGSKGDVPNYNEISWLGGKKEQHVNDHELHNNSSRKLSSRLISCEKLRDSVGNTGLNAHLLNQGTECENKTRSERYRRDYEEKRLELIHTSDCTEGVGLCNVPNEGSMHIEKMGHGRTKLKSRCIGHTRSSRVTAGDVMSRVGSPCLSISDVLMEESSLTSSLYGNEDDAGNSDLQGCGISCCWSRTPRYREPNLLPDVEEQPLLLGYSGKIPVIEHETGWKHNNKGVTLYLESPRSLGQKFRPKSFKELVGQNVVARSLLTAISNGRITSLFLFHGPRGTGKTSASRIFAAALNCLSSDIDKPCGLCQECLLFFSGRNSDIKEVDSVRINRKGRIKSLIKNAEIPPVSSRFKVYIIDECHLLKGENWATILNNLEELSHQVVFIAITPDLDKLPRFAVLKSQKYHFTKLKETDIINRLGKLCVAEGVDFDMDALSFVATKSKGSLRDAEMMLDQLSLVGKKITLSLVYEAIGVVSDDELLDLLHLALSSDASNTVKRARELMRSRIDPLQLTSQLANLIMDILAGKCPEGISEGRRKLFGSHSSEADIQQLSHALKILSETEKQLQSSKNQTTWLTAALLQMSSLESSTDANESRLSIRTLDPQSSDFCSTSTNSESLKYLVTCSCDNIESRKIGMPDGEETLELMWKRATGMCQSNSLKKFLRKRGKLIFICLNQGLAVAGLEFHHRDHVHKAERSWKLIASALQCVLGCNVELRINLACNAFGKKDKFKRPCLSLFGCSRRMHLRSQLSSECGNDTSENFDFIPKTGITRDKSVETCSLDCGSQLSEACCHGKEVVKTIRNQDGNALSIGVSTPNRSFTDDMGKTNQGGFNPFKDGSNYECLDLIAPEHENQTGYASSIQNLNMSNASRAIHSSNQQQCNLALSFPCKTSSETYFSSSRISASRVSTKYCNSYKDNIISQENSKLRCWRTAMFPFWKAWKLTRQRRGEHMVDCELPCAAAAQ
ncbi:STICHEL-like 2 isoform X1 [Olea europaea subsp. europaea]|uniref:STICHEL-like 2 isoform X1 n=1 Tax=Olea europaea subsp. europaea TaxID=158383 RepID=A0A8S0PEU9_OLEEU|nr:STICHEL-like 2 isoform X1 [Olea europaea subsp. europaea]